MMDLFSCIYSQIILKGKYLKMKWRKTSYQLEMQLGILLISEEDPEVRENLNQYWETSKSHPKYDNETIVHNILCKTFSFI